jgi:hypothetical protein
LCPGLRNITSLGGCINLHDVLDRHITNLKHAKTDSIWNTEKWENGNIGKIGTFGILN